MIGIFQIVLYAGVSAELVWVVVGGFLNFAFGLPIYLSFKKGIFYGVKSLLIYQSFGSAADANYYLNDYKLIINMMLLIKHIISGNLKLCAFLFYEWWIQNQPYFWASSARTSSIVLWSVFKLSSLSIPPRSASPTILPFLSMT